MLFHAALPRISFLEGISLCHLAEAFFIILLKVFIRTYFLKYEGKE